MAPIPTERHTPKTLIQKSRHQVLSLAWALLMSGVVSSTMTVESMLVCPLVLASITRILTCRMDRLGMVFQTREGVVNSWRCCFPPSSCIILEHPLHTTTPYFFSSACTPLIPWFCMFKSHVWLSPIPICFLTLTRTRDCPATGFVYTTSRHVHLAGKQACPKILANEFAVAVHTQLGTSSQSKVLPCSKTKYGRRTKTPRSAPRSLYFYRYPSNNMDRPLSSERTTVYLSNQG